MINGDNFEKVLNFNQTFLYSEVPNNRIGTAIFFLQFLSRYALIMVGTAIRIYRILW